MSAADTSADWTEANQRHLVASIGVVRAGLADQAAHRRGDPPPDGAGAAVAVMRQADERMPSPSAIDQLAEAFGLSHFERQVVLLCAGTELDGAFPALIASAQGDPDRTAPTFGLAMATLSDAHWSAISPSGPLRRWRLIDLLHGDSLASRPLRIDERVLHFLTGIRDLDERLHGMTTLARPWQELPGTLRRVAERVATMLRDGGDTHPVIELHGVERSSLHAVAASACLELGMQLHVIAASDVPPAAVERETLARLIEREAALSGTAFAVDIADHDSPEIARSALALLDSVRSPIVLTAREPTLGGTRPSVRVLVERPTTDEQRAMWHAELDGIGMSINGWLDPVVDQFNLGLPSIQTATEQARARITANGGGSSTDAEMGAALWDACREQSRSRFQDLSQRVSPLATWDDLVLPQMQIGTLREISVRVRQRTRVYETWGFARKSARGLGISALFAGPSGTGKTMAAEVLAIDLSLDLYRIDLSQVVSKYIGETEKNIRRVFDAAEGGGGILLFDEADALFGKRSEVKDSHDRYANIEVSYLLQRMEEYRGLAILTTNLKGSLDSAFLRRLQFVVQFPFPDLAQRARIWRHVFPAETPLDGVDPERLARLNVAGGNIRNVAMTAAFLAADAQTAVGMSHLLRAARMEYAKLERPLTDAEIGGWT